MGNTTQPFFFSPKDLISQGFAGRVINNPDGVSGGVSGGGAMTADQSVDEDVISDEGDRGGRRQVEEDDFP